MSNKLNTEESFNITNLTRDKIPGVPFAKIKNAVLGKNYSLSLVFVGDKKSQELNRSYRGKNKPTNVLSFPLDRKNGEIFINLKLAKKEARGLNRDFKNFVTFLFIHGLMHLKGYGHGSTMEKAETKLLKKFGFE